MSVIPAVDSAVRTAGEHVARQHPEFESWLVRARDLYARAYVQTNSLANRVRYDAPVEPYRLLWVDPDSIDLVAERWRPMFREAGIVVDGDWDDTEKRFEEMDVYRAYERHFEQGVPWEDTDFFERIVSELRSGKQQWGCRTRSEFEARCERLDDLYDRISSEGYLSQEEMLDADSENPIRDPARLKTERFKDEIAVHVGRDGSLLFADGRNRLSITKLLDLDEIPVRVLRRHSEWQAVRDAYVRGDPSAKEYAPHPDLAYLEYGT